MDKINEVLFKEYDSAQKNAHRMDELRHKVTSYYLAFTGIFISVGATAIGISFKQSTPTGTNILSMYYSTIDQYYDVSFFSGFKLIPTLILSIFIFWGVAISVIQIKLRRVELENFDKLHNIRKYFETNTPKLLDIIGSDKKPQRFLKSGAFILSLLPLVTACILVFIVLFYICFSTHWWSLIIIAIIITAIIIVYKKRYLKQNKDIEKSIQEWL